MNLVSKKDLKLGDIVDTYSHGAVRVIDLLTPAEYFEAEDVDDPRGAFLLHTTDISAILSEDDHRVPDLGKLMLDFERLIEKESGCSCGAKHTSFPQYHLSWCSKAEAKYEDDTF